MKLVNNRVKGTDGVQLYENDLVADVIRPLKELKAFERVTVEKKAVVEFTITNDMLKYNNDCEYKYNRGQVEILIGLNSRDLQTFTIHSE